MGSWDIVQQRRDSCLIAILVAPGGISIDWALAFAALQKPQIYDVMRVAGLPFGEARTQAAYQLLNGGYSYLFFLDQDIIAPPNTITQLMSHRLQIVSALYYQRFPTWTGISAEYLPCMFNEGVDAQGNSVKQIITNFQYGQLVEATFVPGGALLVHRSVFERFLQAGIKRFFVWTLTADVPTGLSEDFYMTKTARDMFGIRSYVDTSLVALHETTAKITMKGLEPKI